MGTARMMLRSAFLAVLVAALGVQAQAPAQEEPALDLGCFGGTGSAAWASAKRRFLGLLKGRPLQLASREALAVALEGAVKDLNAAKALGPEGGDDCGLGKVSLQLVSLVGMEDPTLLAVLFNATEALASPVLTVLLDVPWVAVAQTGWPVFGLLAQISIRKSHIPGALNNEAVDGLDQPEGRSFQAQLAAGLAASDSDAMFRAAAGYLEQGGRGSALATLTAIAAQAAVVPPQDRLALLQAAQNTFKQVIGSAAELDIALGTRWPLWGLLHEAVDLLLF